MKTEENPLHQVHQQVQDALAEHGSHPKGDWVRPPEDGDVRRVDNALRLTLRRGLNRHESEQAPAFRPE